jgi:hypothetical protein
MKLRVLILLLTTVLPGLGAMAISTFYLFPEWMALDRSYRNYERLAATGVNVRDLLIAESAEMRHRINCFAEGIGVLVGGVIVAIGVHGCTLPKQP